MNTGRPIPRVCRDGVTRNVWHGPKPGFIKTNAKDLLDRDAAWRKLRIRVVSNGSYQDGSAIAKANAHHPDLSALADRVADYVKSKIATDPRRAAAALTVLAALVAAQP